MPGAAAAWLRINPPLLSHTMYICTKIKVKYWFSYETRPKVVLLLNNLNFVVLDKGRFWALSYFLLYGGTLFGIQYNTYFLHNKYIYIYAVSARGSGWKQWVQEQDAKCYLSIIKYIKSRQTMTHKRMECIRYTDAIKSSKRSIFFRVLLIFYTKKHIFINNNNVRFESRCVGNRDREST